MKHLYRCLLLVLAILLGSFCVQAQVDALAVVESSLNAMGSKADRAKVRNLYAIADCVGPRGPYTTEIYAAYNVRLIFKQVRAGSVYQGQTNGAAYWTRDAVTGDFALADQQAAFAWRSHDFQMIALDVRARFHQIVFAGYETFAGRDAVKLKAIDELGHPAELFFDRTSKLMIGLVIQDPFSEQPRFIRNVVNEWKTLGKLRLPSKLTVTDHQGDFVLNFREIAINKVDETVFRVPAQVVAMNELLELHRQGRVAHFQRDANLLVSGFAEDFASISNGKIQTPTRQASLDRFTNYFRNSRFLEWDDIVPPVIRVSNDATMGFVIVNKRVRLMAKESDGSEKESVEIFAWLATYRKIDGKWKLTALASTNTPEDDK